MQSLIKAYSTYYVVASYIAPIRTRTRIRTHAHFKSFYKKMNWQKILKLYFIYIINIIIAPSCYMVGKN